MKRFFAALTITVLVGAGCIPAAPAPIWLIGDSRCSVGTQRIATELSARTYRPVNTDCRPGATAWTHPLAVNPPQCVCVLVFMFGPNELSQIRDNGVPFDRVFNAWQNTIDKSHGNDIWVSQQTVSWTWINGGSVEGWNTRRIAEQLDRWISDRRPIAPWGATADANVRQTWPGSGCWFKPWADDPQHFPAPGDGWGPIALARVISDTINAQETYTV